MEDCKKWERRAQDLPLLGEIQTPRCYKPEDFGRVTSCEVHNFSDASDEGYGTVSYLRLTDENNNVHCAFLFAKSRVTPLKKTTTPRMELTAAVMSVKISNMLLKELEYKPDRVIFWTDSTSVLWYITNETARFKTFVANRVAVINDSTDPHQWRYVDTKQNPADNASRGLSMSKFHQTTSWLQGPEFLWFPESHWPATDVPARHPETQSEVKQQTCSTVRNQSTEMMERLLQYFSDWTKLKKTIAWLLMAKQNLKTWISQRAKLKGLSEKGLLPNRKTVAEEMSSLKRTNLRESRDKISSTVLSVEYLKAAEESLVKYVQAQHFTTELKALGSTDGIIHKDSPIFKLDPVLENGILRVGGRLRHAHLSHKTKHPILLPKKSFISRLLDAHKHVGHLGKNSTLVYLREEYWVIGAASLIKSIVAKCIVCRKLHARKGEQIMADLPKERLVADDPPFTRCGIDYCGTFEVKRGRSTLKRYEVIFTYMNTRAVHLEFALSSIRTLVSTP